MSFETCVIKARKWLKENSDLKISAQRLTEMGRQLAAAGGDAMTPAQFEAKMQDAVTEMGERMNAKVQAQKALDLSRAAKGVASVLENTRLWQERVDSGARGMGAREQMAVEAFRARIEGGSLRPGESSNLSITKMTQSLKTTYLSVLRRALGDDYNVFMSNALEKETYQELDAINRKQPLGQSGSEVALRIAKAMKAVENYTLRDRQGENPFLEKAEGFYTERNHSREKITADPSPQGKAAWMQQAMQTYGEKSFPGLSPDEKLKAFDDIYKRIAAGNFGTYADKTEPNNFFGVQGAAGSIARRMAEGRTLISSDWQTEYAYMSKYGNTLSEGVHNAIHSSADQLAKMSKWGSRAQENFITEFNTIAKQLDGPDKEAFLASKDKFIEAFKVSMGSQNSPATTLTARSAQGMMALQSAMKGGTHLPRSLPDIQNAVTLARDEFGKTLIQNAAEITHGFFSALAPYSNVRERMLDLNLMARSMVEDMHREIGTPDSAPGMLAKTAEVMGRLSLADRQQASIKFAMAKLLSKEYGGLLDTPHPELDPRTQQALKRNGIGVNEWNLIREASETISYGEGETRNLLTPEAIRQVSDDAAELYLRRSEQWTQEGKPPQRLIDHAKFENALKFGTLLNERADLAGANADVRQKNWLYGDTDMNSGKGLLWRMLMQFKTASVVSNDILRRSFFSGTTLRGDYAGVAQHIAGSAFWAAVGAYALTLTKEGKTPESPTDPHFMARVLMGSAAPSVFGDALLNAAQGGKSMNDVLVAGYGDVAGPSLGTLGRVGALGVLAGREAAKSANGQMPHYPGKETAALISSNSPNLFYTRAALNYYLLNGIHEFMGQGGYLGALERQTSKTEAFGGGEQKYLFGRPMGQSFFEGSR